MSHDGQGNEIEPPEWEIAEVERRTKAIRALRLQLVPIEDWLDGSDPPARLGGIRVIHPYRTDSLARKLFLEDAQEDHWNAAFSHSHCEHLGKHYPGYQY